METATTPTMQPVLFEPERPPDPDPVVWLNFEIPCIPPKATAQGSSVILKRKDGTAFVGKPAKSRAQKAALFLAAMLSQHRPDRPLDGPVSLSVVFTYPWRKSEPKKRRALGTLPMPVRPDADNLMKLMLDAMTRVGFWTDDGRVFDLRVTKLWGDDPGITVAIRQEV